MRALWRALPCMRLIVTPIELTHEKTLPPDAVPLVVKDKSSDIIQSEL